MANPPTSPEELKRTVDMYRTSGENQTIAANKLGISRSALQQRLVHAGVQRAAPGEAPIIPPAERLQSDRDRAKAQASATEIKSKYGEALKTIERLEREVEAATSMQAEIDTFEIKPKASTSTSEATPVLVLSDWHIEERVEPATVSGLNKYNLDIAKQRAVKFFQSGLRLTRLLNQDVKIDTMVLAIIGDLITNDIHAELAEVAECRPIEAALLAKQWVASGIEFLLAHSPYKLVIPCHSGNHARTTKTTQFATEEGHSLEYFIYSSLADYFRSEPRVKFLLPSGYHSYVRVYDKLIRFHHGHAIKYNGGIGGIYIPGLKAVSQWNRAVRADLDVFAHFHQYRDGGAFYCNGSMIGYNPFALSIKADFEEPKQTLFLVDKRRGFTCRWPILFS